MAWRRSRSLGRNANETVNSWAARVDDQTGQVAQRVSQIIVVTVRALRIPSAIVMWLPVPFIVLELLLAAYADGAARVIGLILGFAMAAVSAAFAGRRYKILRAVEEPDRLATELAIMISLSDKVGETRTTMLQLAGAGGWRVFSRLQGLWHGTKMTGQWIDGIGDLPRARYFGPPKIGTTVTVTVAALWLIPISVILAIFAVIGTIASAF